MKDYANFIEKTRMLIHLMKNGCVKVTSLAAETGLSARQIYRYLEFGCEQGLVYRPARGVYYPSDVSAPSQETFSKIYSQDIAVRMSQSKQHNKTKPNYRDFEILDFEAFKIQSLKEQELRQDGLSDMNVTSQKATLVELAVRILQIARIPYGKRDLNYALKSLSKLAWWRITDENIEEYTAESIRRMMERLQIDPHAVKTNVVGYFFGIFANVFSADASYVQRAWKEFLPAYIQMAAGAEEVAVTTAPSECVTHANTETIVETGAYVGRENDSTNTNVIPEVPLKWLGVQELLNEMVRDLTTYGVKTFKLPIARLLNYLDENEVKVSNVESALKDVKTHDERAAMYLISKIQSNHFSEAQRQINRHFVRSLNRASTFDAQSSITVTKPKERDERYAAFYELFPDS